LSKIKCMNIHQLSVLFDERQDRLLMRVNTQDAQEIRLWLTRRIALKLTAPLELAIAKMESRNASVTLADAQAQSMLVELRHDDFLKKADLKTPFASKNTSLPLGAEPLIVTEITINIQSNNGVQMVFQDSGDQNHTPRNCTLHMQPPLLHGLLHLLQKAMKSAQWRNAAPTLASVQADGHASDDDTPGSPKPKRAYTH
jgi:hypothetical protein